MKYVNYNIVFQEVPDETTLAINISNCPCKCSGCHSSYLIQNIGDELDETALNRLVGKYMKNITCVAFMGGDADVSGVMQLAHWLKSHYPLKVAWYSGRSELSAHFTPQWIDYVKVGPYKKECGGLENPHTNQKMFKVNRHADHVEYTDITQQFWKKSLPL